MSKKITLENVDSSELPEIPVIGEVKQIRFTQDMELVSTLADSDLFMVQAGADLEARPNTITFDLIIKNLSGPIEEGSKKFVTGDMMFKVIGDMNLLNTWDNTNLVSSLNATYVNVRRIEEELRREINRSTGKDEQHDEQIANLRQDLTSTNEMLNQEISRSVAKDKEHDDLLEGLRDDVDSTSNKLDAEIDRSTAKDAEHDTLLKGLRVDVNANKSAIDSEVARSTARDEAHDTAIAKNASDITTEVNRAKAEEAKIRQEMQTADTNLQNAITAETERATGVEEDLQQQITDLSGSTDDRLEALEALSHEQNTDTGTTSKTFVIDSGNTGAMLKAEGGGLSTRTKGDAGYANFTVNNLVIKGDVTQEGDTFITRAERVEVRDNMILINEGETGAGVTAGFAGIEVDRGTEQNFMFGFNESDGMFKIGKEGNMFDVALRQPAGDMTDGMFASWDAATKTFKTTNLIPPTLQLYLGVPEVSVKYIDTDDGSIKFMTNGKGWSAFTSELITNFCSDVNKFQFIGDVSIYSGKLSTSAATFNISVAGGSSMVIDGTGSTLSTPLTATSFFRASDKAEVMYATDSSTLTDGMFLSWDADNKKVVTTNKVPYGGKLYLAFDDVYITQDGRSIEFHTNDYWWRANTSSSNTMFSSSSGWFDFSGNIIVNNKVQTTASTLRLETTGKCLSIGNNGTSTLDTTLKANTFYRFSDSSEVLYQADLKSVLTGKETNYAPTVKAVSDAINAVNTGTTESLKNYLKLSGGNMTGNILFNNNSGINGKNTSGVIIPLVLLNSNNSVVFGSTSLNYILFSNNNDLIHFTSNGSYSIWDKLNLSDPATKSGNNSFTGTNSFVGGEFSVDGSESGVYVSKVGNLVSRSTYGNMGWVRSLEFSDNNVVVARFCVKATTTDNVPTTDFVGILVGDGTVNDSQYKFRTNKLTVPKSWSMIDGKNDAITLTSNSSIFGRISTPLYLRGDNTDLFHTKNSTNYKVWDASNLPTPASTSDIPDVSDMARRSEANTFTAKNTFTAGQFSAGSFSVNNLSSLIVDIGANAGAWSRYLKFMSDSSATGASYGAYSSSDNSINYAWIGVEGTGYSNAQYKFYPDKLYVPSSWELVDSGTDTSLILYNNADSQHLGRGIGVTYIRSGNSDLYHTKGSTNYKILDESNYSQYLPTTNKWTYGFVATSPSEAKVDFNTVFAGPDAPKILYSYNRPLKGDTNSPTGMTYGTVLQIDGNYNSSYNNNALRPQLAFDINHNVENGTRYMWFRTANNLGFGDSSNWKRVVTADENVVAFITANGYPTVGRLDGSDIGWLRTPAKGLLPTSPTPLANGGNSSLGNSSWSFSSASIANVYANNYYFGNTGIHLEGNDDEIGLLNAGTAKKLKVGSLLVSSNYSDTTKVPTNGIFASGAIKSYSGFTSNFRLSDINITKTGNDVWHLSSFANSPENMPGIDPVSGQVIDDGALLTYFWKTDYAFQLAGDIYGTGMAYRSYTPSTGATKAWKFLADTAWVNTKLGSYLPLTGGTMTGKITMNIPTQVPIVFNYTASGGTECYVQFHITGVAKGAVGFLNSNGTYLYNYTTSKHLFVGNDGCYFGTPSSNAKLLTTADNVITAVGGENYVNVSLSEAAKASAGAAKHLEWYDATPGWYNFRLGSVTANGDVVSTGSFYSQTNNLLKYVHNSATHSAISVNKTDGNGYLMVGNYSSMMRTFLLSNNSDIVHYRGTDGSSSTDYRMWDAYNLTAPLSYASGNAEIPTTVYNINLGVNGTNWTFLSTINTVTTAIYAPTSVGTSGQILQSSGTGAPVWANVSTILSGCATQSWVTSQGYLTSITKSMVTTALGYTPPTTNTTYSQATSSTLGLVKIGATGLASKNYAVQLNSSGQMYVAVPWTDTNTTYSAATSSTYGLVKIGATGLAAKNYAVQLNSSGQMYVAVPWTDTDTNTHYTTRLYAGASGTAANSATTSPYIKVTDDDTYRNQIRLLGGGATSVSSDASGNITITSTNTTYGLATASSNGLMSSSQYTKLSNCIETVSATNMVTSVQVVDTIPATSSQVTGRLYLKFA